MDCLLTFFGVERDQSQLISKLLVVVTLSICGCNAEPTPAAKQKVSEEAIGAEASIAAAFWVDASRKCLLIGVPDFIACADSEGTLLDERSAQKLAKVTIDYAIKFSHKCKANFSSDYCDQLFNRAVDIENRKPRRSD